MLDTLLSYFILR